MITHTPGIIDKEHRHQRGPEETAVHSPPSKGQSRAEAERIWAVSLAELQLQMTADTFNHWLKHTRALGLVNGTLRVAVQNEYAREWLDNRLRSTVERTLGYVAGELGVEFVVEPLAPVPPRSPRHRSL